MEEEALVFFPPPQFSKRFGRNFFTVRFDGIESKSRYDLYVLQVQFGDDQGDAEGGMQAGASYRTPRRYSEFLQLRQDMQREGALNVSTEASAAFPPKRYLFWRNREKDFLEQRQELLMRWLYAQLTNESALKSRCLRDFLRIQ